MSKDWLYILTNPAWGDKLKVGIGRNGKPDGYNTGDPERAYEMPYKWFIENNKKIESLIHKEFQYDHEWCNKSDLEKIIKKIEFYNDKFNKKKNKKMDNKIKANMEFKLIDNYDEFKIFDSNREVSATHVKKLMKKIVDSGHLIIPVVVDSLMRIIDGQHRFTACKQLGIPVPTVINHEADEDDVVEANNTDKSWTLENHVYNRASKDLNYLNLHNAIEFLSKRKEVNGVIRNVKIPSSGVARIYDEAYNGSNSVRNDTFRFDQDQGDEIVENLDILSKAVGEKVAYSTRFLHVIGQLTIDNFNFDATFLRDKLLEQDDPLNTLQVKADLKRFRLDIANFYNQFKEKDSEKIG